MITLSPPSTALILVDLQRAVLALQTEPRTSSSVLANCKLLAERFRSAGAPVILSNVAFASDFGALPRTPVDQRSEAHTYELQLILRLSYAIFCLKKKNNNNNLTRLIF